MSIYSKLLQVMSEISYIQKDKTNTFHRYNYASEAAIKEKLHESLVRNRVLFLPYRSELAERVSGLGKDGKEALTTLKLYYKFVDVDSGETHEGELHGIGSDALDKGIYKAITGAIKYILTGTFLIPTGDDPEEDTKEEKKQSKAEGHAQQQQIAERKIAQMNQPQPEVWDWRIALPKFEQLEKQYGPAEVATALKMAGFNSLEETPNREAALTAYEKVRKILAQAPSEQPSWVEKPHKPAPVVKQDPAQKMLERMSDFKSRIAVIQQFKFDLVQKFGQKDGEERYYAVLDKISGHIDTHANEIARNQEKATHCASELYFELHPEAVEVSA